MIVLEKRRSSGNCLKVDVELLDRYILRVDKLKRNENSRVVALVSTTQTLVVRSRNNRANQRPSTIASEVEHSAIVPTTRALVILASAYLSYLNVLDSCLERIYLFLGWHSLKLIVRLFVVLCKLTPL